MAASSRASFACMLAVSCLSWISMPADTAHAQIVPGAPGLPPVREGRPGQLSPTAAEAESYEPRGTRLGSFLFLPVLEADVAYNDNVFATPPSAGATASLVELISPSMQLRSLWSSHMLNAYARGSFGFFNSAPTQNYGDFSIGANGRFDIQRNWNIYGELSFNRQHEDPGLPNTVNTGNAFGVTTFNQTSGAIGYYQKFARLSARVDFRADNFLYFNNGLGLSEGVVPNSDRDRTELREAVRIGYEFIDGYEVWVRGSINQRLYTHPVDAAGFARNSSGWDAVAGLSIDLGGITNAEIFIGYLAQNYVDQRFQPLNGVQFGGAINWNPNVNLLIRPYVIRTVNETAYVGDSGYLNTAVGLTVDYKLKPNVRIDGRASYTIADYESSSNSSRYDQYYSFALGVTYFPSPNFFVGPRYQRIQLQSAQSSADYSQNVFMLRFGTRL